MSAKISSKYRSITRNERIAGWGRLLGYAKSTFSRLHRYYRKEGLTSEEFILKMIRKQKIVNMRK